MQRWQHTRSHHGICSKTPAAVFLEQAQCRRHLLGKHLAICCQHRQFARRCLLQLQLRVRSVNATSEVLQMTRLGRYECKRIIVCYRA